MDTGLLNSVKRPLLVGVASAACLAGTVILWLRFPSLVPTAAVVVVGLVASIAFIVSETVALLRVGRMLTPAGPLAAEVPRRSLIALAILLVLSNGVLLYLTRLQPGAVYVVALNSAVVISWMVARRAGRKGKGGGNQGRPHGSSGSAIRNGRACG